MKIETCNTIKNRKNERKREKQSTRWLGKHCCGAQAGKENDAPMLTASNRFRVKGCMQHATRECLPDVESSRDALLHAKAYMQVCRRNRWVGEKEKKVAAE
jgi:hypothetical protein